MKLSNYKWIDLYLNLKKINGAIITVEKRKKVETPIREYNKPAITGVKELAKANNDSSIPVITPCLVSSTLFVSKDLKVGIEKDIPKFIKYELNKNKVNPMFMSFP
ncbi:MAG: hypothetical protein O2871_01690 [bacterium]|nr:hypothetical protein [bacterium]